MPLKGYKQTEVHRRKGGEARRDKHPSEETRRKMSEANRRRNHDFMLGEKNVAKRPEVREKIRKSAMGKRHSMEARRKMSKSKKGKYKGKNNHFYGKKHSAETRKKISEGLKGKMAGAKNPRWNGGTSFAPYTIDWTQSFKRSIRERDNYICQLCGELQGNRTFDIHHKDENKTNCNPDNLITLCRKCHQKLHVNMLKEKEIVYVKVN